MNPLTSPRLWPAWGAIGLLWLLGRLPVRALWVLGAGVGALLRALDRARRRAARRNLEVCFPQWTPARRARLLRAHFRALGQAAISVGIPWWASESRLRRIVTLSGREHVEAVLAARRNVIFLIPHFVALEISVWLTHEFPMVSMYKAAKNPVFDRAMRTGRARFGNRLFERDAYLKDLLKSLKAGRALIYLPDQNPGRKRGVFVKFFGVDAATHAELGRFARIGEAEVIPCIMRLRPRGGGYEICFKPPLAGFPTGDAAADTQHMNDAIEQAVRAWPEQYLWVHRRFKVRPDGDEGFYN